MDAWRIGSAAEVTLETLAPVLAIADRIRTLFIGLGDDIAPLDPAIRPAFRAHGITIEAMPTRSAVTTYNILRWETAGIERSSVVLFWMPFFIAAEDDPASLPGFTTRAEVSRELARAPERIVLGMPGGALSSGHIRYHAHLRGVRIHETLEQTVAAALARLRA